MSDMNTSVIPIKGSVSGVGIALIWLAANLVVTTLLTGTLFVPGVTYGTAIAAIVVGTLLGALILTMIAVMGTRTGLSTMALARGSFGIRGATLPTTANIIILMGWSWVQAMLAGISINYIIEQKTGYSNPILFSALCQVIVVVLAIFGHDGIAKIEPYLGLVILGIVIYIFAVAFTTYSPAEYFAIPADKSLEYTGMSVFDIVFATAISWTVLSADLTRTARTQRGGAIGTALGYSTSTITAMTLGATAIAFVLLRGGEVASFDPTVIIESFGWPLAIAIFLSVTATNTMVVYGMATSAQTIVPRTNPLPFLPTALVLGAISVAGATWLAMLDQFTNFLVLIGAFFIPVFAIMIIDYYVARRRTYAHDILRTQGGRYWFTGGVNIGAVATWIIGCGVYLLFTFVWPLPIGASLPTIVLSAASYLLFTKLMRIEEPADTRSIHLTESISVVNAAQ
ncbi:purine-cytosine permease family protein [Canibacter zhoujuaniae]|uniref:purine-cytosine permease family protein n=1 Tax=Canibacter zhoujuaniae TaxID=2708343 RepID=UPI0014218175|nr:cytosine permease [Canibacter zhoujuaniae]